jgi:hypothetical protein
MSICYSRSRWIMITIDYIQEIVATTLSMLLTFALHCTQLHTATYNSLIQSSVTDISQHSNLRLGCQYGDRQSRKLKYIMLFLLCNYLHRFQVMHLPFASVLFWRNPIMCAYGLRVFIITIQKRVSSCETDGIDDHCWLWCNSLL